MGRRKKKVEESSGGGSWLTTYSDLVTLLLCFFILLFSMAIVDKHKFDKVALSVRAAFSGAGMETFDQKSGDTMISLTPFDNGEDIFDEQDTGPGQEDDPGDQGVDEDDGNPGDEGDETDVGEDLGEGSINAFKVDIQGLIDKMGLNENIKVIDEGTKIILRMDSVILFDTGSADLKTSAKPVIKKIGEILKTLDNDIQVQGHADDRPINTREFPSNWELSTKRATNVVKFLIDECDISQENLTATGNAEFRPIVPNDSEYNRQKNRRIDIAIFK
ncbi:MAG: OmpA family protein [Clostridiaceae bacterium]|jgi:chemotaxis protein MotB|nr:OmpA family protein [Clostridiaceae bacterium]